MFDSLDYVGVDLSNLEGTYLLTANFTRVSPESNIECVHYVPDRRTNRFLS